MQRSGYSVAQRKRARYLAVQAIFQWQFGKGSAHDILRGMQQETQEQKIDLDYFTELVKGVEANIQQINQEFSAFLERPMADIDRVEAAILRLATYELLFRPDIPIKVVINEALELTKTFCSESSFKFVNSVLDRTAKKIRSQELGK